MTREFQNSDDGKHFRYIGSNTEFHGLLGQLEYPLVDPGSALPGEGVLWFGPVDERIGWEYVSPADVK